MPRVHERATFDPCTRPRYVDLNRGGGYVPYVPRPAAAASYGAVAPQPWQPMQAAPEQAVPEHTVPVAPPQLSADGYWWWTGSVVCLGLRGDRGRLRRG